MKVKDIKVGEIFVIDNTMTKPKLKLEQGYVDMSSLYMFSGKKDTTARVLTEADIMKIRFKWKMTEKGFENYKQMLIRRYIKEEKKK